MQLSFLNIFKILLKKTIYKFFINKISIILMFNCKFRFVFYIKFMYVSIFKNFPTKII